MCDSQHDAASAAGLGGPGKRPGGAGAAICMLGWKLSDGLRMRSRSTGELGGSGPDMYSVRICRAPSGWSELEPARVILQGCRLLALMQRALAADGIVVRSGSHASC